MYKNVAPMTFQLLQPKQQTLDNTKEDKETQCTLPNTITLVKQWNICPYIL